MKDDCDQDDLSPEEMEETCQGLVKKGILKEIFVDGVLDYEVVSDVELVILHCDSDPKTRN